MKRVLVLGSSGQVGAYLVNELKEHGHKVFTMDIVNGLEEDLRIKSDKLETYISKSDFVFFLAFDVGGSRYLSKYQHTFQFLDNNIKMMDTVFSYLNKYKTPFIFASSQMSNMSYSPYGILKAVGEQYTRVLQGRTVKFWNVYGIEHDPEKSHVITDFINKARNAGVIDMMTDGEEEREFLYAEDCTEALITLMNRYDDIPEEAPLHITSFLSTTIIDIANIIAMRYDAKVVPSDKKDSVQMDKRNQPDKFILNYWQPKTSINKGIELVARAMEDEV